VARDTDFIRRDTKEIAFSAITEKLHILQQVTDAVHNSLDLDKVFSQITDGIVHSMGYTTAFFFILDDKKKNFKVKALSTKKQLLPLIDKILGSSLRRFVFPADPELNNTFRSAIEGNIVVARTLAEVAYPLLSKKKCTALQKLKGTKSYIIVPLKIDKEVLGGVFITSSQEKVTEEELSMLKSFSYTASNAIQNARLHRQATLAQEELKKSEEKYKFLVDHSREIILVLSKRGKILFVNKTALKNFGYSEEELFGKSITRFLTKDSIRKSLYAVAQEFLGRPQPIMEVRAKTKSGEIRHLEVGGGGSTPIRENGKWIGIMFGAADITERKKAEKELQVQRAYFEPLFESAQEAIITSDNKGKTLRVNSEFCRLFGYTPDEIIGQSVDKLIAPENLIQEASSITKKAAEGNRISMETVRRRKDGTPINVSILASPIVVGSKQVGIYGIYRDITERKKAYEELKNSEERLKILFEFAPDAYYLNDLKGRFVDGNLAAEKIMGYKREELIGKSFLKLKLLSLKQLTKAAKLLAKNARGKPTGPDEFTLHRKDGTRITIEISTYPVKIKGKTLVLGIARDITDRKKARNALRKSEREYRTLFEHASDAVFLLSLDGVHLAVNNKAADMLGYSTKELVGKSFKEVVVPDEFHDAQDKMKGLLEGKTFPVYERRFKKKDGTEFPVEINVALVRDEQGKPLLVQSIVRDITQRKKTEETLRESEAKYRILFESIADPIVIFDKETHRFLDCNKVTMDRYGYTLEELRTMTPHQLHPTGDLEKVEKNIDDEEDTSPHKYTHITKKGERLQVDIHSAPLEYQGRKAWISIIRDVTEQKRAEEALRESEEKYRSLSNQLPIGIYRSTKDGKILHANPALASILDYESVEELVQVTSADLYDSPSDRTKQLEQWKASKGDVCSEIKLRTKKNRDIWVRDTGRIIFGRNGEIDYIDGTIENITERKLAEEKIKSSLREKELLLQEVHHRVKNNMQIISSLFSLQSKGIEDEEQLHIFKSSQDRVKSMALIHERLYQSGDFARVDFAEYTRGLTSHLFGSYGIAPDFIKSFVDIKDVFLDINTAIPCGLVINELVSNSLKHAFKNGQQGEVRIGMSALNGNEIDLVISDNGVGLPEDVDFRNTESLGLRLVSILAESQLHGNIEVDRTNGTSFHIRFKENNKEKRASSN